MALAQNCMEWLGNYGQDSMALLLQAFGLQIHMLSVPGYTCFCRDRPIPANQRAQFRGYGGVAILVRDGTFLHAAQRSNIDSLVVLVLFQAIHGWGSQ